MEVQELRCVSMVVEDGAAAVEAVSAYRKAGTPFDAVFMDVQMPVMDGIQAVVSCVLTISHVLVPLVTLRLHL